ncbi:regucalcin [Holotrichia oblita]|uniref:Regucalcin n=1 Tax=Holotrichia oblita TaxID=644536 RepID=A0ACB9TGQ9_HOLOL|nr:regucalcin [Holotrichia oblita]
MSIEIVKVTPKVTFGEGPFWDDETKSLYFVDVLGQSVSKYTPATESYSKARIPAGSDDTTVSCVLPVEGVSDEFLVTIGNELVRIRWDGKTDVVEIIETVAVVPKPELNCRFNDAKADSYGQIWIGYFATDTSKERVVVLDKAGGLISIQRNKSIKQHFEGISLANGLDWNKNQDKLYFTDSTPGEVLQFDCNLNTHEISNKQVLFRFSDLGLAGMPDGMVIDENDNLWIANFGGGQIINVDTRKPNTIIRTIDLPVKETTSVAFGGPSLDELYVTTGSMLPIDGNSSPEDGYVYKISGLGVRGFAGKKVKL